MFAIDGKFNYLVGLGGVLVQLGLLDVWTHFHSGNYLLGTALARRSCPAAQLRVALCLHLARSSVRPVSPRSPVARIPLPSVEWRGLPAGQPVSHAPARHHEMRLPLLLANGIAILACSAINFLLGRPLRLRRYRLVRGEPPPARAYLHLLRFLVAERGAGCVLVGCSRLPYALRLPQRAFRKPKSIAGASVQAPPPITQYSLPPDKLAKAHALYTVRTTLHFAETIYGLILLLFVLRFQLGAQVSRLR